MQSESPVRARKRKRSEADMQLPVSLAPSFREKQRRILLSGLRLIRAPAVQVLTKAHWETSLKHGTKDQTRTNSPQVLATLVLLVTEMSCFESMGELQHFEVFAGDMAVTKAEVQDRSACTFLHHATCTAKAPVSMQAGRSAVPYDIRRDGRGQNLLDPIGFIHAVAQT